MHVFIKGTDTIINNIIIIIATSWACKCRLWETASKCIKNIMCTSLLSVIFFLLLQMYSNKKKSVIIKFLLNADCALLLLCSVCYYCAQLVKCCAAHKLFFFFFSVIHTHEMQCIFTVHKVQRRTKKKKIKLQKKWTKKKVATVLF